ncbi:hypothetical protein PoB_005470800 [Plakobranchus ocellatus]|uniref:Uncharacterized protein n=1 Tax=Plakobranchus ocellatus TaxID=259542 RepID=A0AAV4C9K8_9GAST|nr:hypothetical protein PoB_005470800 [Plakobranchus ocellatus]
MPYAKNNQDPTPGSPMLGLSVGPTLLFTNDIIAGGLDVLAEWMWERKRNNSNNNEGLDFCIESVHNKMISGFKALRQAGAPMSGLEPATEGSPQISGGLTSHCTTDS